ncbi:MAG: hypothetical protein JSS07_06025 [Proteobacteria bacterium]|nr:hypothetical protein [Pseudomonadota bacterium]
MSKDFSIDQAQQIHQAAKEGNLSFFTSYETVTKLKFFTVDEHGFSPLYYAVHHEKQDIVDWYKTKLPSEFPKLSLPQIADDSQNNLLLIKKDHEASQNNLKNFVILDNIININLSQCGLTGFKVDPTDNETGYACILKLFNEMATTQPPINEPVQVDETSLTYLIFGILEQVKPFDLLKFLSTQFFLLNYQQQSLCVYLIKELIKHDTDNEYIKETAFEECLTELLDDTRLSPALKQLVKPKILKYYELKCKFKLSEFESLRLNENPKLIDSSLILKGKDKKVHAGLLAKDLCQIISDQLLKLTFSCFLTKDLANNEIRVNNAWSELVVLINQISNMVSFDILEGKKSKDRRKIVQFYVECIKQCLEASTPNFGAAMAIYSGLYSSEVSRLPDNPYLHVPPEWDNLFDFRGCYASLHKLTLATNCALPYLGTYSSVKVKGAENPFYARMLLWGRINYTLYLNRLTATQYPSHNLKTEILHRLRKTAENINDRVKDSKSYNIKPPKIIHLDSEEKSLKSINDILEYCKENKAPLVVCVEKKITSSNLLKGQEAINALLGFIKIQFPTADLQHISQLCKHIVQSEFPYSVIHLKKDMTLKQLGQMLKRCQENKEPLIVCTSDEINENNLIRGNAAIDSVTIFINQHFASQSLEEELKKIITLCVEIVKKHQSPSFMPNFKRLSSEELIDSTEKLTISSARAKKKTRSGEFEPQTKHESPTSRIDLSRSAPPRHIEKSISKEKSDEKLKAKQYSKPKARSVETSDDSDDNQTFLPSFNGRLRLPVPMNTLSNLNITTTTTSTISTTTTTSTTSSKEVSSDESDDEMSDDVIVTKVRNIKRKK